MKTMLQNYSPVYESKVTFSVIKEYNGNSNFTYNKEATDRLSSSFLTIIQSDLMISTICEDLQDVYKRQDHRGDHCSGF